MLLFILVISVIAGCNSADKDLNKTKQDMQTKQDRIIGYAPVNGLKIYYEIKGHGTPIVLIHGGGSTINTTFGNILPLLAKRHKVIALELQAHGHTNDRDKPESFEQDADDVAGLLQYLNISQAHFFGFSNGGNTAMQIAIRHPAIVNKLVIASSFYKRGGMIPGFFEGLDKANLSNMPTPLKTAYLEVTGDKKGLQNMFEKDRARMAQFKDWDQKELLSIKVPTLLIVGDKDVVTTQHTVEMSQKIPDAELMILPGSHGSYIGEICSVKEGSKMPAITVAVIEEFLDK